MGTAFTIQDAMQAAGITPPVAIIDDHQIHRFGKNLSCWYISYWNCCFFGDWRTGTKGTWHASNQKNWQLTPQQKQQIQQAKAAYEAERLQSHQQAALTAQNRWNKASEHGHSPYLQTKGVNAYGLRFEGAAILIPLRDVEGNLHSLQSIAANGDKLFQSGGRKKGCFHAIGDWQSASNAYLVEGYATAATVHMATGLPVICCFDASNLASVAEAIKQAKPDLALTIAADNDWLDKTTGEMRPEDKNTGLKTARQLAAQIGCAITYPRFEPHHRQHRPSDFNDLMQLEGLNAVTQQLTHIELPAPNPDNQAPAWPAPDASLLKTRPSHAPAFPLDCLPESLQQWASDAAKSKNAPLDYVASGLLATAAGAIGNTRIFSPWDGWAEPCIIWLALVGNPSSGKSPALDAILSPVNVMQAATHVLNNEKLAEHAEKEKIQRRHERAWQKELDKSIKDGTEPPPKPPEAKPVPPPQLRHFIVNDATIEKLADILASNQRGIILHRDELAGLLTNFERRGGDDRQFFLESFGGRPFSVQRVKYPNGFYVPMLAICLIGGTQPDKLASLIMAGDDDGLAARFLYVWPDPVPFQRPSHRVNYDKITSCLRRLSSLEMLHYPNDEKPSQRMIPFTHEAADFLANWLQQKQAQETRATGLMLSFIGKMRGMAIRLAGVLAYLEWAADDARTHHQEPDNIQLNHISGAIRLVDDYFIPHAARSFSDAALAQDQRDAVSIARWLIRQQGMVIINSRQLGRMKGAPVKDTKRITAAFAILCQAHWLRFAGGREGEGWGKQRLDYEINPQIFNFSLTHDNSDNSDNSP